MAAYICTAIDFVQFLQLMTLRQKYHIVSCSLNFFHQPFISAEGSKPGWNRIKLHCKGADSIILKRLKDSKAHMVQTTLQHLEEIARAGYRTLCIAEREVLIINNLLLGDHVDRVTTYSVEKPGPVHKANPFHT